MSSENARRVAALGHAAGGVIESLNMDARTVTFSPTKGKAPAELVWTRQTKFVHNRQFAPAST